MTTSGRKPNRTAGSSVNERRLDEIVARARREASERMKGYREQSLRLHPWVCARCGREFTRANLHELTVHHKDHDHNHNPPDGSNWENLCLYCHDWEHQKYSHLVRGEAGDLERPEDKPAPTTQTPFSSLKDLLGKKNGR